MTEINYCRSVAYIKILSKRPNYEIACINWLYALPFINNCYLSNGTGVGTIYCPSCGSKGRFSYWFVSISSPGLVFLSMLMNSDAFLLLSSWSCLSRDSDSRCWAEQRNQNVPNKLIILYTCHIWMLHSLHWKVTWTEHAAFSICVSSREQNNTKELPELNNNIFTPSICVYTLYLYNAQSKYTTLKYTWGL